MAEAKKSTEKDINQIVRYLTNTFNVVIAGLERAQRVPLGQNRIAPNRAYIYQTEFAYRLNEVMIGPRSLLQKNITECNEYIDTVMQEMNALQEAKAEKPKDVKRK